MPIESYQLFRAHAAAQGHKGLARSMNISKSHTYVLTTPSEDRETQVRDDVERLTSMCEASATRGSTGRVANKLTEVYFKELFDRLNRNQHTEPLTCELVVQRAQRMCERMADVLKECRPGFIPDAIAREAAEMIVELESLIVCAEAADDPPRPHLKRA